MTISRKAFVEKTEPKQNRTLMKPLIPEHNLDAATVTSE